MLRHVPVCNLRLGGLQFLNCRAGTPKQDNLLPSKLWMSHKMKRKKLNLKSMCWRSIPTIVTLPLIMEPSSRRVLLERTISFGWLWSTVELVSTYLMIIFLHKDLVYKRNNSNWSVCAVISCLFYWSSSECFLYQLQLKCVISIIWLLSPV